MKVATRRVDIAGRKPHPNERWMAQVGRDVTLADDGFLVDRPHLLRERDSERRKEFGDTIAAAGVKPIRLPPRSPRLKASPSGGCDR